MAGISGRGAPPAQLSEGGEERRAGVDELGLAGGEVVGEAGVFEEAVGGEAELVAIGLRGIGAVLAEGFLAGGELLVEDGRIHEEDALEAPLDAGELADEVVLDVVLGEEDGGEAFDEALEGGVVFVAEDEDGAGVAAVFEGVEAGAGLAFRGFGAAAAGAVVGCHGAGSPPAGSIGRGEAAGCGHLWGRAGKWLVGKGIGDAKKSGRGVNPSCAPGRA